MKAFQEFSDLEPDGVVGPLTWQALLAADTVVTGGRSPPPAAGLGRAGLDLASRAEPGAGAGAPEPAPPRAGLARGRDQAPRVEAPLAAVEVRRRGADRTTSTFRFVAPTEA